MVVRYIKVSNRKKMGTTGSILIRGLNSEQVLGSPVSSTIILTHGQLLSHIVKRIRFTDEGE